MEENVSRRSETGVLKADVKHSFAFMMRDILQVLAQLERNRKEQRCSRTGGPSPSLPVWTRF